MEQIPKIKELFKEENLCIQNVYKAKENYNVIYINSKLYEDIFEEKYDWKKASLNISEKFSITLDEQKSNNQLIGKGYSDKQFDPTGMALSGNLGSGRAYFYGSIFNIKGDKTELATSPNSIYSNGKYALSAAIKETIMANILSEDFIIPTFQTLAILETKERFDFIDQYLDYDNTIKEEKFNLPCCIEIRVNKEKELYRISNSLINGDTYTISELEDFCRKIAVIEANKFCDRFLHGSWSVGNISVQGNLIDFDTASFVKGRNPQYSNTNKYKSNYFGYELLGQKLMIKSIIENTNIEDLEQVENKLFELIEKEYNEHLRIRFCDLIGLDYNKHYQKYSKYIDSLCDKFNILARKFIPNYYETNVVEPDGDSTFLFDFSRFFQTYLIEKEIHKMNPILGTKLLLNDTEKIQYENVGMIKEKIEQFFRQDIVNEDEIDSLILDAINFIKEYDELFSKLDKDELYNVKLKQYIINANRNYIYANQNVYGTIAYLYDTKQIDNVTLNKIINAIIKTNKRNNYDSQKENIIGLELYKDFLTYFVISKKYYYLVIEPFSSKKIEFAKAIINGKEIMISHSLKENENTMISEKIELNNISDLLNLELKLRINAKKYDKKLID